MSSFTLSTQPLDFSLWALDGTVSSSQIELWTSASAFTRCPFEPACAKSDVFGEKSSVTSCVTNVVCHGRLDVVPSILDNEKKCVRTSSSHWQNKKQDIHVRVISLLPAFYHGVKILSDSKQGCLKARRRAVHGWRWEFHASETSFNFYDFGD